MRARYLTVLIYLLGLPALTQAQFNFVHEVIESNPSNGGAGAAISAVNFAGQPAAIYERRNGNDPTYLAMAVRGPSGWTVQPVNTPAGNERMYSSDAVSVNGITYAAVAIEQTTLSSIPNSLRILKYTPSGWQTVFERMNVGKNYGRFVRLGTFNGQLAAVYGGVDGSSLPRSTQFLYQDSVGNFHEESAPTWTQGSINTFSFAQNGDQLVVAQGGPNMLREVSRDSNGNWSSAVLRNGITTSDPATAIVNGTTQVFDVTRGFSTAHPYLMSNAGGGWSQSDPFSDYQRVGGSDWLQEDGRNFVAYSAGDVDQAGSLYLSEQIGSAFSPVALGPALTDQSQRALSTASGDGWSMIAMMNELLPSGQYNAEVYVSIPEPVSASVLLLAGLLASGRRAERMSKSRVPLRRPSLRG